MTIETVRISQQAKDQLIKLKRHTGIKNWNVLCRWAFCASLAEPSPIQTKEIPSEAAVEMSWKTFGGKHQDLYLALLKQRIKNDGIEISERELSKHFKLHLHRGISYLSTQKNTDSLFKLIDMVTQQ